MDRKAFLIRLVVVATVFVGLCFLLCVLLGAQIFSFYGVAIAGLIVLVPLAQTLFKRARHSGRSRWPSGILIAVLAVAAIGQIGFWLGFFYGGGLGTNLAVARSMAGDLLGNYLVPLGFLSIGVLLWIIGHLTR